MKNDTPFFLSEEDHKQNRLFWMALIGISAFFLRLLIAAFYRNGFDLNPYNIPWALGTREGVFSLYKNVENLDYPPLFPFLLSLVADGVAYGQEQDIWQITMLFIKLIPVLFDVGIVLLLYQIGAKQSEKTGILLSLLWTMNLSSILNSACWGQTDSLLLFFTLLTFWLVEEQRPVAGCVAFALGCLSKLQMAYFAPVLLLELFFRYPIRRGIRSLCTGVGVGIAGWLPFMIGSREWLLPLRIYLGGFGKYKYINVNAFNLYGIAGMNWVTDRCSLFGGSMDAEGNLTGGFTYGHLSVLFLLLLLFMLIGGYATAKWRGISLPAAFHGLVFLNGIFMLTTKMHERYQLPVLVLSLLCCVILRKKVLFGWYLLCTVVTFWNQATVLWQANFGGVFRTLFERSQFWGSLLNGILFFGLMADYIITVFGKDIFLKKERNFPQED